MFVDATITIRRLSGADADAGALAALHIASWRAAYSSVLPEAYLTEAAVADRHRHWRRMVAELVPDDVLVVAEAGTADLVGMTLLKARPESGLTHHLDTCLVGPSWRASGIGTLLLRSAAEAVIAGGGNGIYVWVLDGSTQSLAFYERLGAAARDRGIATLLGGEVPQTRIVWADLPRLVEQCAERLNARRV